MADLLLYHEFQGFDEESFLLLMLSFTRSCKLLLKEAISLYLVYCLVYLKLSCVNSSGEKVIFKKLASSYRHCRTCTFYQMFETVGEFFYQQPHLDVSIMFCVSVKQIM